MKLARIRQIEKMVRSLQSSGYEVKSYIKEKPNRLVINIKLSGDNAKEIMAEWNDLRQVDGS